MAKPKRFSALDRKDEFFKPASDQTPHPVERLIGPVEGETEADQGRAYLLPVDRIQPDPNQPRKTFSEESIKGLATSIQEKGLLQPIAVRKTEDGFILVAGERRWRAHLKAEIPKIWAVIVNVNDPNEAFEISLVENLQREDLDPLEEAAGIAELMKRQGYKQRQVGKIIGRSESQISKLIKLNKLPQGVKEKLATSQVSRDQLFQIAAQETPEAMLKLHDRIVKMGLNVRETRQAAKDQETPFRHPILARFGQVERFLTRIDVSEVDELEKEERLVLSGHLKAVAKKVEEVQQRLLKKGG